MELLIAYQAGTVNDFAHAEKEMLVYVEARGWIKAERLEVGDVAYFGKVTAIHKVDSNRNLFNYSNESFQQLQNENIP
jgi:lactam utilization protein B